jgi:hypothetical protein
MTGVTRSKPIIMGVDPLRAMQPDPTEAGRRRMSCNEQRAEPALKISLVTLPSIDRCAETVKLAAA